ncbi:MAG: GGDEF domain-containing protein, partial [Solirubrobacterales bacterium]
MSDAGTRSMDGKHANTHTNAPAASPSAPQASASRHTGGQAALKHRLSIDPNIRNRSLTGAILWGVTAVLGAIQQFGPSEVAMTSPSWAAFLIVSCTMALLCLFVGPRLAGRTFRIAEEFMVTTGWIATALLVAATGGASSADLGLFASFVFYSAYFMAPREALRQIAIGSLAIWAPLAYDFTVAIDSGFVASALVMTAVLWAMAALVARNRHVTQAAELRARRLALTDPLTGVANLHTFEEELKEAIESASTEQPGCLGVAFVDVNGLKAANTVFGHAGGDELIRRTADALLQTAADGDQVARVGGDEFAVIVPGGDADQMRAFEAAFAIALSEAGSGTDGAIFELSASIGTAVYPQDGSSFDELMAVADERMYDSKSALPPRLPTPETSGGRALQDPPEAESSRFEAALTGAAPAAALAWLLGAGLIIATAAFSASSTVHLSLALALSGICVAAAGYLGLVGENHRRTAEKVTNTLAVLIAVPVIYATGGATTPILPLAYLVVAHASFALSTTEAIARTGAMLAILFATLFFSASTANVIEVMVISGGVLAIAGLLQYNRRLAAASERRAIEISRSDALTKIANRRVFEHKLAELSESEPEIGLVEGGLVLADVDNFKTINTAGGHKAGDEVLRMIASVIEGAIGNTATVCRIGGDEFAIVVEQGDYSDVMRAAAKCRAAVGGVDWKVLCEPDVTLSIGYASWDQVSNWKDLVVAADLAMQTSKEFGKNAVTMAPMEHVVPQIGPGSEARRAIPQI